MTNYREDDILGFIQVAEQEADNAPRKPKIRQTWIGDVAVKVPPGVEPREAAKTIYAASSKNWSWSPASFGDNWMLLTGSYTVKGANADDAEKVVLRALKGVITENDVAIQTKNIYPAGLGPLPR